jgi:hypothetical protein
LFEGELNHQLKLWLAMGIYAVPLGSILGGLLLRFLAKVFFKVIPSIGRAIWVQFVAMFFSWLFQSILVGMSLLIHSQTLFQTLNGVASLFIGSIIYAKMLRDPESKALGIRRGLILSAVMSLIAILLGIPIKLLRA